MDFQTLLWSVVVPGLIALGHAALASALLYLGRSASAQKIADQTQRTFTWRDRAGRAVVALAFAAAFVFSFYATEGWPGWPPHSRWQWLLMIGAWAGLVSIVAALFRNRWWCVLLTALTLAVPSGLMLQPLPIFEHPWLWRMGLMLAIAITFLSLHAQSTRRTGGWMPLAMLAAFAAGSIVIVESGFAKLGLMAAAMAASCAGVLLVAMFARRLEFGPGPAAVVATLLPTLMMLGWFYNEREIPFAAFALVTLAPLSLWAAELLPITTRRPVRVAVWIGLLVILPALAVFLSMWTSEAVPDAYDYYSQAIDQVTVWTCWAA